MKKQEVKVISGEANEHQKHAKLKRPQLGQFGRNEVAILGTPCGNIKQLCRFLADCLKSVGPVGFVDADHQAAEPDENYAISFTDKIQFRRFDYIRDFNSFQLRSYFNNSELVLVNGNHFKAAAQIVVLDPKKSLEKKLDRITAPLLVVKISEEVDIPDYLESILEGVPVLTWDQAEQIAEFLRNWMTDRKPKLKGLVLAGGKSMRMKRDKGSIDYHGTSQRQFLYHQLSELGVETLVSCRQDQKDQIEPGLPILIDTFQGLGPMGALLSAFREDPDVAWLAVACDLPYLTDSTLEFLIKNRDQTKVATAFKSPNNEFPEPLITIWEPRSYKVLFDFLSQGYSCPRKVMINSPIHLIDAPETKELSNVNHPEEYELAIRDLRSEI